MPPYSSNSDLEDDPFVNIWFDKADTSRPPTVKPGDFYEGWIDTGVFVSTLRGSFTEHEH